jgi:hypothetical protein
MNLATEYQRLLVLGRLAVEAGDQARAASAFGVAAMYARETDDLSAVIQHIVALGAGEQHDLAFSAAVLALEEMRDKPEASLLGYMAALSAGAIGRFPEGLEQARQAWPDLNQEQRERLLQIYSELGACGRNRLPPRSDVN